MQKKIQLPKTDNVEPVDKTLDEIYEILPQYQRFDEGMHMNLRRVWEPEWKKGRTSQRKPKSHRERDAGFFDRGLRARRCCRVH